MAFNGEIYAAEFRPAEVELPKPAFFLHLLVIDFLGTHVKVNHSPVKRVEDSQARIIAVSDLRFVDDAEADLETPD